ncbi:MAG: FtsX-like permease family protein [Clostridia bacterium]|nr:FtsX-like permease family protein [Clostridia bacterium]
MITASLLRRRSRMLIALLSIGIGATILSGLVTIYYDVPRQMGAQFRSYGANMILLPEGQKEMSPDSLHETLKLIPEDQLVGATPYRYVRLDMTLRQQSFTSAGTDFSQVQKTSPYFSVEGRYPENDREVLVGKEIADTIGVKVNSPMQLTYKPTVTVSDHAEDDWVAGATLAGSAEGWNNSLVTVTAVLDGDKKIASIEIDASTQTEEYGGRAMTDLNFQKQFIGKSLPLTLGEDVDALTGATVTSTAIVDALNTSRNASQATVAAERTGYFTVTGILETGGEEESYVFISLSDMAYLTGENKLDVAELSISANADQLDAYVNAITEADAGVIPRLVKRVTRSETAVLSKLQALVFLVTAVVLLLTMICVSTTMMAVVSERRREIGLRKALGASDNSIRAEFLGEGMFLGGLGGIMGSILGFVFAQVVSVNVFGSSIMFQPLLLPITVIVSMVIAALSCLLPIKRAVAIDPALVLKGE